MTTTSIVIVLGLLGVPIYAAIGALMYHYLRSHWPTDDSFPTYEFGGILWPAVLPIYVLIIWPIKLALRLPIWWAARRETRAELPRATTVKR